MPDFTGTTNFHLVCKAKSFKHPESCINLRRARLVKLNAGLTLHNGAHKNESQSKNILCKEYPWHPLAPLFPASIQASSRN